MPKTTKHDTSSSASVLGMRLSMKPEKIELNARIFESVIRGSTFAAAGEAEGLTPQRARQIMCKMRRVIMNQARPLSTNKDHVDAGPYRGPKEMRLNADFWLAQLAKWRTTHSPINKISDGI